MKCEAPKLALRRDPHTLLPRHCYRAERKAARGTQHLMLLRLQSTPQLLSECHFRGSRLLFLEWKKRPYIDIMSDFGHVRFCCRKCEETAVECVRVRFLLYYALESIL